MINIWCHDDRQVQKTSVRSSNSSSVRLFLSWIIIPGRRRRTKNNKEKKAIWSAKNCVVVGGPRRTHPPSAAVPRKKKRSSQRDKGAIKMTSRSRQPVDTRGTIALLLFPAPTQTCLSLSFYMYKYQALGADMSRHRDVIALRLRSAVFFLCPYQGN